MGNSGLFWRTCAVAHHEVPARVFQEAVQPLLFLDVAGFQAPRSHACAAHLVVSRSL
jgi:hypothetical protein